VGAGGGVQKRGRRFREVNNLCKKTKRWTIMCRKPNESRATPKNKTVRWLPTPELSSRRGILGERGAVIGGWAALVRRVKRRPTCGSAHAKTGKGTNCAWASPFCIGRESGKGLSKPFIPGGGNRGRVRSEGCSSLKTGQKTHHGKEGLGDH